MQNEIKIGSIVKSLNPSMRHYLKVIDINDGNLALCLNQNTGTKYIINTDNLILV